MVSQLPNPYGAPAKGLPNPYAAATVAESAPVRYTDEQAKAEQQKRSHAFHNPHHIRRPQAKGANTKKTAVTRPVMSAPSSDPAPAAAATAAPSQQPGLDWWRSTEDDDAAALDYKRYMDRQQKERKKQEKKFAKQFGYWKGDAPYKADRPSNLRAYRASGAYRAKLDSFNDFLRAQAGPVRSNKPSNEAIPMLSASPPTSDAVPPPSRPQFAPPASYDAAQASDSPMALDTRDEDGTSAQRTRAPYGAVPPPPPPPPPTEELANIPPPPPPPASVPYNPTISAPPVRYAHATISAPPTRYNIPEQIGGPTQERPAKRTKLSKAEAMMAKMGYKKGEGLGKNSDGITTHLEVKARKDKRVADAGDQYDDNGPAIRSQQVFDILGGRSSKQKEPDKFGQESKVIVAWGCVDGIDWSADSDRDDGGVRQEMGQTFDEKFGRVERVYVHLSSDAQPVYIKFASELSALNAVNRFSEGYQFRGRNIRAQYYSEAKFEASVFDY